MEQDLFFVYTVNSFNGYNFRILYISMKLEIKNSKQNLEGIKERNILVMVKISRFSLISESREIKTTLIFAMLTK